MYAGFELKNLNETFFSADFEYYLKKGKESFESNKIEIEETLKTFINKNGSLNGNKMQSAWFPQINADVFLSHSHTDENLIIAFAGWLRHNFNLKVFIDSCIWGYSMNLQKILDREYNKDNKYNKAIYASSHVHMMLNTALMQMIDNCEGIIFVNTPNSVRPGEVIDKVVSPWIYSEIGMTKLIRKKSIVEHRNKKLFENTKHFSDLEIEYNLDTDHLTQLTLDDLSDWDNNYKRKSRQIPSYQNFIEEIERNALDNLYELKKRL